jgi:uncharacterized membrane protein
MLVEKTKAVNAQFVAVDFNQRIAFVQDGKAVLAVLPLGS